MHARAYTTSPAEGAVAPRAWILTLFHESFGAELVWLREVGLVQVDWTSQIASEQGEQMSTYCSKGVQ